MAKISDEAAANRLARAIVEDIRLYHADELASEEPLPQLVQAIEEGRMLFRNRVAPQYHDCFEAVLAEQIPDRPGLGPRVMEPSEPSIPQGFLVDAPPTRSSERSIPWGILGLVGLVGLALAWWFLLQ